MSSPDRENSVRDRIIRKAKDAELSDFIYRVEVPTELISEVRNGKRRNATASCSPGTFTPTCICWKPTAP